MAVKLIRVIKWETGTEDNKKNVVAELCADAKTDITDDMRVIGMPSSYNLQFGSYVCTKTGNVGILGSDGEWSWVGEEEDSTRSVVTLAKSAPVVERQQIEEPTEEVNREEPEEIEEPIEDEDDMR